LREPLRHEPITPDLIEYSDSDIYTEENQSYVCGSLQPGAESRNSFSEEIIQQSNSVLE